MKSNVIPFKQKPKVPLKYKSFACAMTTKTVVCTHISPDPLFYSYENVTEEGEQ
jgi:hypothetical protein